MLLVTKSQHFRTFKQILE